MWMGGWQGASHCAAISCRSISPSVDATWSDGTQQHLTAPAQQMKCAGIDVTTMSGLPSKLMILPLSFVIHASSPACLVIGPHRASLPAALLATQPLVPDDTLQGKGQPGGQSVQPRCMAVKLILLLSGCCSEFLCRSRRLRCLPSSQGWRGTWDEDRAR